MRGDKDLLAAFLMVLTFISACGPSLHSSDHWDRYHAVKQGSWAQDELFKMAMEDTEGLVRDAAVDKITDEKLLTKLAIQSTDAGVRKAAAGKLSDQALLSRIAREDKDSGVRLAAVNLLNNPKILATLALEDNDPNLRIFAAEKVSDQALLTKLAMQSTDAGVRKAAAGKLSDQALLSKIAREDKDSGVRLAAVQLLNNPKLLAALALGDNDAGIRKCAAEKIDDEMILTKIVNNRQEVDKVKNAAITKLFTMAIGEFKIKSTNIYQIQKSIMHNDFFKLYVSSNRLVQHEISADGVVKETITCAARLYYSYKPIYNLVFVNDILDYIDPIELPQPLHNDATSNQAAGKSVSGTTWAGPDSLGVYHEFYFNSGGSLHYRSDLHDIHTDGLWRQKGNKIYLEMKRGYAKYIGIISGNKMDGTANSITGHGWSWSVQRL